MPESYSPIRMKTRLFSMKTRMFQTERARMRISADTIRGEWERFKLRWEK